MFLKTLITLFPSIIHVFFRPHPRPRSPEPGGRAAPAPGRFFPIRFTYYLEDTLYLEHIIEGPNVPNFHVKTSHTYTDLL